MKSSTELLREAIDTGNLEAVKQIIEQEPELLRASLYDSCVPAMEILIDHGANVNSPGVLIAACEGKALACMEFLLSRGARATGSAEKDGLTIHWNAFTHAAHFNKQCPGMLALLLQHGVHVDDAHPHHGNTPGSTALINAARQGDVERCDTASPTWSRCLDQE